MSDKGKRTIYVGPADGANHKPLNIEGVALSAATLPGTILSQGATGLSSSSVLATVFGQVPMIADKDQQRTKSVDDAWTQNENMVAMQPRSGEFFNALVITGQAIASRGVALSRSAPGLKIALTDGTEEIVAYSDEIVTTTGTELVRVKFA